METIEQREIAGYSPVGTSKIDTPRNKDKIKDEAKLHRIEAKELRLLNNNMAEYEQPLAEALSTPRDIIKGKLQRGEFKTSWNPTKHVPYKYAA